MFEIIVEYPDSRPAINDLKVFIMCILFRIIEWSIVFYWFSKLFENANGFLKIVVHIKKII